MAAIQSFSAISGVAPQVLILGSIPGVASLQAKQYYAHPRNAFWPIMAAYFDFELTLSYSQRISTLLQSQVALWDVLQQCQRQGSLDSDIKPTSIQHNPIDQFVDQHPSLKGIVFNGAKAAHEFHKAFSRTFADSDLLIATLPSTSPAYAAMKVADKMTKWHQAMTRILAQ